MVGSAVAITELSVADRNSPTMSPPSNQAQLPTADARRAGAPAQATGPGDRPNP